MATPNSSPRSDAIVIGRKTFETVLAMESWPLRQQTRGGPEQPPRRSIQGGRCCRSRWAAIRQESFRNWPRPGLHHLYVDGGITVQGFLRAGLVQSLVITRVPVLIGVGIPLFGALPHDIQLHHVATRHYPSGLVQSEYQVVF